MGNPRVCIKYNQFDLLRIIPFPNENEYDFKISFLNNEYKLRMHQEGMKDFLMPTDDFKLNEWEITYHRSKDEKPTKYQLKNPSRPYFNLPLKNLVDPIKSSEFPIPFLKLGINKNLDTYNSFKDKKDYRIIDLNNFNVLELYIVSADYKFEEFMKKWDLFDLLYTVVPMEYFVNGKYQKNFFEPKLKTIYEKNQYRREIIKINDEIGLLCNFYIDENINGKKQDSFISLYENGKFQKYLSLAPISYGATNKELAYIKQLRRNKNILTDKEFNYWNKYFENLKNKANINNIDGFSLPEK